MPTLLVDGWHDYPLPGVCDDYAVLRDAGVLSPDAPDAAEPADAYRYDPADPTPAAGGIGMLTGGPADNRDLEARDDVLVYTSEALTEPLEHVSFGFGEHYCLGAELARLQMRVVLEEWFATVDTYAPADDTPRQWLPTFMMRGLVHYRVHTRRR